MNNIQITGRLGQDPKLTEYDEGKFVCEMSVAIDNGKYETTWIDLKTFNGNAKPSAEYLHKGSRIAAEGRIEREEWVADDGSNRHTYILIATNVEFLDPKEDE